MKTVDKEYATGIVTSTYYTCHGSPRGCERERFGMCAWHDQQGRESLVTTAASDSLKQLLEHGQSGARFVKWGGDVFIVIVRFDRHNGVDRPVIGRERMSGLRDKVSRGLKLNNLECRELFAFFGNPIEQQQQPSSSGATAIIHDNDCDGTKYSG